MTKANTSVLLETKRSNQKPVSTDDQSHPPRYMSPRRIDEMKCVLLNKKEKWIVNEPQ